MGCSLIVVAKTVFPYLHFKVIRIEKKKYCKFLCPLYYENVQM